MTMAGIEDFLAWRVVRTGRAVERALTDSFAEHELSATQFGVLSLLATGTDLTQSELAREVLVRPQSVGPLITSLVDRGLITRRGPGGRGRRTHFDLTPTGRALVKRAWSSITKAYAMPNFGLDANDSARLDDLLRRIETSPRLAPGD